MNASLVPRQAFLHRGLLYSPVHDISRSVCFGQTRTGVRPGFVLQSSFCHFSLSLTEGRRQPALSSCQWETQNQMFLCSMNAAYFYILYYVYWHVCCCGLTQTKHRQLTNHIVCAKKPPSLRSFIFRGPLTSFQQQLVGSRSVAGGCSCSVWSDSCSQETCDWFICSTSGKLDFGCISDFCVL